ncbi:MAG: transglutaminase N-terminal domain-containing protein, partial [Nocardioides sp.]
MRYAVRHTTTYTYDDAVSDSLGVAYLVPRALPWQQVPSHRVTVTPTPADLTSDVDYYGNRVTYFQVSEPHRELCVEGTSEVESLTPVHSDEAL